MSRGQNPAGTAGIVYPPAVPGVTDRGPPGAQNPLVDGTARGYSRTVSVARSLVALVVLATLASERDHEQERDSRRPRPLSWLATRGIEAVDLDDVIDGIDVNAIAERIDVDELLSRVDVNELLQRVDVNALAEQVDIDALLATVDVNAVLDQVDPDRLLDRVDPDRLLDRVDPNRLLDRVDPDRLLDRVDPNRLLDRVDVDRFMDRVDVDALVERAGIADIVADSTGAVAGSVLDVARRQLLSLDTLVQRFTYRLTGRDPADRPVGPPKLEAGIGQVREGRREVSGSYAGPVSRVAAFVLDALIVFWVFTLTTAAVTWVASSFGINPPTGQYVGLIGTILFIVWAFLYSYVGLSLTGKTVGKGIVGLQVLDRSGAPLRTSEAAIRTLALPLSFLTFFLGVLLILVSPRRLTLHDMIAKTCEVYDWGDRPAELPAPLTAWIYKKDVDVDPVAPKETKPAE